jgi:hypothetical protein
MTVMFATVHIVVVMVITVCNLLDLVHNVILIEYIFGSGKPQGSGFWARGAHGYWENKGGVSLRATGSRGGRILTQQGGFQVSRQGEQGEPCTYVNLYTYMYAMNE